MKFPFDVDTVNNRFKKTVTDDCNVFEATWLWLKNSDMDAFHGWSHYTREQVAPLLADLYNWCEKEHVAKPKVRINHSVEDCPTGLCPDELKPNRFQWLGKRLVRAAVGGI